MQVTIDPRGFGPLAANYRKPVLFIAQNEGLRRIGKIVTPVLKANTPRGKHYAGDPKRVAGQRLAASTRFVVGGTQSGLWLEIRQGARTLEGVFYGGFVRGGTRPHVIRPRDSNGVLRFRVNGQVRYAKRVNHPGNKPNPYHVRTLEATRSQIAQVAGEIGRQIVVRLNNIPRV